MVIYMLNSLCAQGAGLDRQEFPVYVQVGNMAHVIDRNRKLLYHSG
jgi:hypothetical protein